MTAFGNWSSLILFGSHSSLLNWQWFRIWFTFLDVTESFDVLVEIERTTVGVAAVVELIGCTCHLIVVAHWWRVGSRLCLWRLQIDLRGTGSLSSLTNCPNRLLFLGLRDQSAREVRLERVSFRSARLTLSFVFRPTTLSRRSTRDKGLLAIARNWVWYFNWSFTNNFPSKRSWMANAYENKIRVRR